MGRCVYIDTSAWFNAFGLGQLSEDMISIDLRGMNGFELQARFKRFRLVKVSFE